MLSGKVTLDNGTEVSLHEIARKVTPKQLAAFLSDAVNKYSNSFETGKLVGVTLQEDHPSLQRMEICLALGLIVGLSGQNFTDPRNETAVETAKKIARMAANGELPMGMMI